MRVETFQQLLTPEGQRLLSDVAAAIDTEPELALATRLRRDYDADLAAAATEQVRLRRKARTKFGDDADRLYFTAEALEQATRRTVADHRAVRVRAHGVADVVDLTCGIGGDLIAFARAGMRVHGIDYDPLRAAIAAANLAALDLPGTVDYADATADQHDAAFGFIDPARRDAGQRRFDPRACVPDWTYVTSLLTGSAAAKVAPGIAHDVIPTDVEAEWVSDRGALVEACLWGMPLATATRRATLLPSGANLTDADLPSQPPPSSAPGRYLYEPDDAVTRAHLVTAVAAEVDGWLLDPHLAYIGSDRHVATPFATAYEVLEELPYREKALRAALRTRDVGTLTVKKRGVDVVPERLIARLRLTGTRSATVVLCRVDGHGKAYLVRPVA